MTCQTVSPYSYKCILNTIAATAALDCIYWTHNTYNAACHKSNVILRTFPCEADMIQYQITLPFINSLANSQRTRVY